MVPHICQYTKNHCFMHCRCVNCIVYEVYLNKAVERKEGRKEGRKGQRSEGERRRGGKKERKAGSKLWHRKSMEPPAQSVSSQRRLKVRELRLICFQTMFQNIKKWISKFHSKWLSKHSYVFQKGSQLVASMESEFDARRTDPGRALRRRDKVLTHSEGQRSCKSSSTPSVI